ncbi:MAG: secretin N-terminal domain-containing protein [Armatimonadota bacterium]
MQNRFLKLTITAVLFLMIICIAVPKVYAQEKTIKLLDFSGADLVDVIKLVAKECKYDCVIASSVQGKVNMHLKNVPLSVALGVILKTAGYDYRIVDDLIVVALPKELPQIASNLYSGGGADAYQVIMLEQANCNQIVETLRAAVPGISLSVDERVNAIVANGSVGAIKRVKDLIAKLDVPAINVFTPDVQTKVISLKYAQVKDIESQLQILMAGLDYQADERTNSLVVRGTKQVFDALQSYLDKTDIPLEQVALEVKVLVLSKTAQANIGANFSTGGTSTSITTTIQEVFNNQWSATPGYQAPPTNIELRFGQFFPFVRSPISMNYAMDALVQRGIAEIVANPTVTTLSGKEADLISSRKFRYVKYDSRTGEYSVDSVDVGVTVKVTPTITSDGYVVVNVKPEISDFISLVANLYPYTNERSADITVRVKDGEPIIIGGLRRKAYTNTVNKIPLLGDLPIVGSFFKGKAVTKADNEVVIIVTPRIIAKTS